MKFSIKLPTDRVDLPDEFVTAQAVQDIAKAIEEAGFDAAFVTEHPMPFRPWLASGGHHALDPFVALSFAAAATRTLRLHTNILVLAYRNPFLSAKGIASLDYLSGGRVIMGVAAGYLKEEFDALGAPFDDRLTVLAGALDAIKRAWAGPIENWQTPRFHVADNIALPRPLQSPHPPIWVGGNSKGAMECAVRHAQGWSPFPVNTKAAQRTKTRTLADIDELARAIRAAKDFAAGIGRSAPLDICMVPFDAAALMETGSADRVREELERLEAAGVTWLALSPKAETRKDYLACVQRLALRLGG